MVYKKYIKRGGKIYGPYAYHSKKVDGKVITQYLGKHKDYKESKEKNKTFSDFLKKFIVFGFIVLLFVIFSVPEIKKSETLFDIIKEVFVSEVQLSEPICNDGEVRSCEYNIGACSQGTQECNGGSWGECQGFIEPEEEICDSLDNDCDGLIDESGVCADPDNLGFQKLQAPILQDVDFVGYILEFVEKPLAPYFKETQRTNQKKKAAGLAVAKSVQELVSDHRNKINNEHANARSALASINSKIKINSEFTKVLDGFHVTDLTEEEIARIKQLPYVKSVTPNYVYELVLDDTVPLINADDVWPLLDSQGRNITGKNVTIAIIDTGVDYTHGDLGGCFGAGCKVKDGWDFVNNDADPMDDNGHGTHVAATAAGNGVLKGVAPDAIIYAYKVCYYNGFCVFQLNGIERAVDPNDDGDFSDAVDVISISIGGSGNPESPVAIALDNAMDLGVVAVVAAGNSGPKSGTIGIASRKAITVAASDNSDNIVSFSSRGPVVWSGGFIIKPDVAAPGVNICAAQWDSYKSSSECIDTEHTSISGTSMAAPHVSGAAALLVQAHPEWSSEEVKSALMFTAKDIGYEANTQGAGRIDVLEAVNSSILISPMPLEFEIINLGLISSSKLESREVLIKNLRPYDIDLTFTITNITNIDDASFTYDVGSVNVSSITIGANSNITINVSLDITPDLKGGIYTGDLLVTYEGNVYNLPYSTYLFSYNLSSCAGLFFEGTYFLENDIIDSTLTNCLNILAGGNVTIDCQGHTIDGRDTFASVGIRSIGPDNITIKNCVISDWHYGIYFSSSDNSSISNTTANSNNWGIYHSNSNANTYSDLTLLDNKVGLYFSSSPSGITSNSLIANNSEWDVFVASSCGFELSNITGTDNKPIVNYYNKSVNLQNWNNNASQIILCEADNSVLNNITMSHTNRNNNGILIVKSDNLSFTNIDVSNSYQGIRIYFSYYSTFSNINLENNSIGLHGDYISYSNLTNITSNNNSDTGMYLRWGLDNFFSNITANYNINEGFRLGSGVYIEGMNNNQFSNIHAEGNTKGILIRTGTANNISNSTILNNINGLFIRSAPSSIVSDSLIANNSEWDVSLSSNLAFNKENCLSDIPSLINVNGTDNKPILLYGQSANLQNWNNNFSEIILCGAHNSTLNNITLSHTNKKNNGIFIYKTDNSSFTNINVSNSYIGLYLSRSTSNNFSNITTNSNVFGIYLSSSLSSKNILSNIVANLNDVGIFFESDNITLSNIVANFNNDIGISVKSSYNILSNITATSNADKGIYITGFNAGFNTLSKIKVSNSSVGLEIFRSIFNNLSGVIVTSNTDKGVYINKANENSLSNVTASFNNIGIDFLWSHLNNLSDSTFTSNNVGLQFSWVWIAPPQEYNNTIRNSIFENNTVGIKLESDVGSAGPHLIYNNIFNNTNNFNISTTELNSWNTTLNCLGGKNIIGGNCIGGNYWSNYTSPGFSDTCVDSNSDGICDDNYTLSTENIDFLPLTEAADLSPPVRSNPSPTGSLASGTTQISISLNTDEVATCKYSTLQNITYSSMSNTFTITGGISHSQLVTGLSDGNSYNYYVRCIDVSSNVNPDDFVISFSVSSPPLAEDDSGSGGGSSGIFILDKSEIALNLKQGEIKKIEFTITNKGLGDSTVSITSDLDMIASRNFNLPTRGFVIANLDVIIPDDQNPDIYIGNIDIKAKYAKKQIAIAIEVVSKGSLFDIILEIPEEDLLILPGGELDANLTLTRLIGIAGDNVTLNYIIKDEKGNEVFSESGVRTLGTYLNFIKLLTLPSDLIFGKYILYVQLDYQDKIASSSVWFDVGEDEKISIGLFKFLELNIWKAIAFALSLISIIIVTIVYIKARKERSIIEKGVKSKLSLGR